MTYRTLIQTTLATSIMLFAGASLAMGSGGNCGPGCDGNANNGDNASQACNDDCKIGPLLNTPVIELTSSAGESLQFMREEEKLARDVYTALGDKWDSPVFNIANAEQKHMNAMKKMLERFGMEDPVVDDGQGVFQTQAFTDLYEQLIESGSTSLVAALKVGAKIEELDLVDLRASIESVNDAVLIKVYGNLERATRNHLRAFAKQIQANGGTYTAEHLSQEEFDAIAASPMERGMGGQAKGQGRGQSQGKGNGQGKNANKDCGLCAG